MLSFCFLRNTTIFAFATAVFAFSPGPTAILSVEKAHAAHVEKYGGGSGGGGGRTTARQQDRQPDRRMPQTDDSASGNGGGGGGGGGAH